MSLKIMWIDEIYNGINGFEGDLMAYRPFLPDERYYISSAACPCCGEPLYKMRAHNTPVEFKGKRMNIYNIFTCIRCKTFYASVCTNSISAYGTNYKPLREYALVSKKYDGAQWAVMLMDSLNYYHDTL